MPDAPNISSGIRLYLINRPSLDFIAINRFLKDEILDWRRSEGATAPEELVELAGRVCYLSFGQAQSPRTNDEYIRNLIEMGHESVLEHATWTFLLAGVSRAFSHQFVRHRVGFAFSQLSQQYHDETDAHFVIPESLRAYPKALEIWSSVVALTGNAYKEILREINEKGEQGNQHIDSRERRRMVRSAARSILPNATETKIVFTGNARAIRHFLHLRGGIVGDLEMRQVSALLLGAMREEAPTFFADFELSTLADGTPIVSSR